ncbi:hypothetical protein METBIDRAFT_76273 [Metschnikowia bicuspidata var. bicuspidata NRRL YB-4993]|uniref:WDR59/RTC1-like RING zinc finger domain-containing protein n=1 Tax=Metschnikowia bicuspidata var. bicuspidata NRRL YB-4993 TaxID=869754 RepID=A0A1A0HGC3_9ASCO|nr:hypothetical protein METBIDRAFT_76273 [Metschnikowia bicuspidata var. bicuspidata NRRL YB-4993]OBA23214.1 hypothetical protein METBIDRAFT_76273 [Metschnikowia bicuspidata var. bicuspidata NRRL YB-4993]
MTGFAELLTFGNALSLRVDGAIGAMSLSPNGRDAVLAGRKGLFIIDLDDPFTPPRWLHHITSWEVADVQWLPHHAKPSWCVLTLNQKALLWDLLRPHTHAIQNVLHRHTRAITDIHFHPQDPELLATCLIDTFVFTWDMRTPRRPVNKYAEWRAGATQVKWNSSSPHQLALSHHHSFYLWDARKGALPLLRVDGAHGGKINGLDFSGHCGRVITCSNDKSIKFWDTQSLQGDVPRPAIVIHTDYPVARARRLPFGQDNCCGIMPVRGGDNAVHVVNYKAEYGRARSLGETVHMDAIADYSFRGHGGPMKDFLWRQQHEHYEGFAARRAWKEYQLVTWSPLDFDLRLWPHDKAVYDVANYNPLHQYNSYVVEPESSFADFAKELGGDMLSRLAGFVIKKSHKSLGRSSQLNHLSWISGVRMGRQTKGKSADVDGAAQEDQGPANLGEEISIVGHKFSKLRFEKISVSTGHIEISLRGPLPALAEDDTEDLDLQPKPVKSDKEKRDSVSEVSNAAGPQSEAAATTPAPVSTDQAPEQKLIFIRLDVRFPRMYPFLEPLESTHTGKRRLKHKKSNQIRFEIEETHELTAAMKKEMLRNLDEIAHFYSNKYHKYCLEPCLRYLMGEKIDLDDSLMMVTRSEDEDDALDGTENSLEVGNENWVDDLIDQHEAAASFAREMSVSADEDDEDADLIFGNNDKMSSSLELARRVHSNEDPKTATGTQNKIKHDSTPLPKGCGAVWTRSGELVCFFLPKMNESEASKSLQKLSVFKFTENGFGLKSTESRHTQSHRQSTSHILTTLATGVYIPPDTDSGTDLENTVESEDDTFSMKSGSSTSSSESFSNDWDEMLQDDIPSGSRIHGLFRGTVALGRRIRVDEINGNSANRTIGVKGSAYKSSAVDETGLKSTRKAKKGKRGISVVSIIDFKHLIPEKYELACDYRVLGDSPEVLARHNSEVAFHHGYEEIGSVWRIVEMLLVKEVRLRDLTEVGKDFFHARSGTSCDFYWGNHPMGHAWMIKELFNYFEKRGNLQMLAMLSCLLFENPLNIRAKDDGALDIPIHTPYPSLPPMPSIALMREHVIVSSEEANTGNESSKSVGTDRHRSISRKPSIMSTHFSRPISPDFMRRSESPSALASLKYPPGGSYQLSSPPLMDPFSQGIAPDRNARSFENSKLFSRFSANARKGSKGVLHKGRSLMAFHGHREKVKLPPLYTIEIKNVELLDLYENKFSAHLLGGIDQNKIIQYREQYAEMLYTWGLPLNRIKILKFNYPQGSANTQTNADFDVHECSYGSRYRKAFRNAWNTQKRNVLQYCGYCGLIISKRVVICTKCEHIMHSHCAAEWWTPENTHDLPEECPTGCGCSCMAGESK